MTNLEWPTPDDVVAALKASGHLLEQRVATQLEGLEFNVRTNAAFTDQDEGKSRELDVFAFRQIIKDSNARVSIDANLLIECKNSRAPYAFLTRPLRPPSSAPEEFVFPRRTHREPFAGRPNTFREVSTFHKLGLHEHYWPWCDPVRAVHITRLDRAKGNWRADNSSVFDSLMYPMAKAVRAFTGRWNKSSGHDNGTMHFFVELFFPIVVTLAPLYSVDGTSENPSATEVPFIRLQRELRAASLEGVFGIDFVQQEHLAEFVQERVTPFANRVASTVLADPTLVRLPPSTHR